MLARFERLMEQVVEGSLRRVFPTQLQPVQLAKAAARAMEQAQVIGVHGAEVPNRYELRLAPADLERFSAYATILSQQVASYLSDYARERGLRPVAEPRVALVEDAALRAGSVRADARFVDLPAAAHREIDAAVEGTRRLRLADLAAAQPVQTAAGGDRLWLAVAGGAPYALEPSAGVVRLGRATDNDLVLASPRVSRYHAQLRWVESSWLVYDLDSTNGTWLDDRRVVAARPAALVPRARLRLGDRELEVRVDEPARGRD